MGVRVCAKKEGFDEQRVVRVVVDDEQDVRRSTEHVESVFETPKALLTQHRVTVCGSGAGHG